MTGPSIPSWLDRLAHPRKRDVVYFIILNEARGLLFSLPGWLGLGALI